MRIIVTVLLIAATAALAAAEPPGARRDPALTASLEAAYRARGEDYVPRTRHLDADGRAKYVNRLIHEASPYLLQHAHNPVDWRPWGPEALAEAEALDRPVFLSVGYSTCHWCHVMEEESFESEEVAALLNAHFVPIKVDREQHPDVDQTYVLATQLQRGHAGWPNSVWMTPQGQPFITAVYLPRERFIQALEVVRDEWQSAHRSELLAFARRFADALREHTSASHAGTLDPDVFARAVEELAGRHNELEGGFGQSTQFPQEGYLLFLLDHWRRTGEPRALDMVTGTLDAIAAGGIHDHVGGGFHRYTVDPNWRTPHFEKMLYNQALLGRAFVEAWHVTGDPVHARAARRAFDYVLREMTAPDGAFYTAEDADSRDASGESAEGAFYVWPADAARAALDDDGPWAVATLGLALPATLETGPVAHLAETDGLDLARLDRVLEELRRARAARARPLRDEKVIAGWNGLMIRALAEGGVLLDRPDYVAAAARAAEAALARLWSDDALARLHAGAQARGGGRLQDYAWLGLGLMALHDATGDPRWLELATAMAAQIPARFADGRGRLKMAQTDGPLGPTYVEEDTATPSGESSALELFAGLHHRSPAAEHERRANELLGALSGAMSRIPTLRTVALVGARNLADGESTAMRALGKGTAHATLARVGDGFELRLRFAEGWHANAADPGVARLVGASLKGATVTWPDGRPLEASFSETPVMVYEGALRVPLADLGPRVVLTLQICSAALCLQPERVAFRLAAGDAGAGEGSAKAAGG